MKSNSALIREENSMELYIVELFDNGGTLMERKIYRNRANAEKYAEALKEIWVYNHEEPWLVWIDSIKTED